MTHLKFEYYASPYGYFYMAIFSFIEAFQAHFPYELNFVISALGSSRNSDYHDGSHCHNTSSCSKTYLMFSNQ
ncbi:hypothetical protein DERP_004739 [Dermatophagoides pteronyssinus]|uniref:Uncharacterized protein n=1 Tax=Dermatophagoides pteronyssinus TaxID=6956 RepID=A0ABQ8JPL5_DERPT|nr:hypothetical protein DERP_004739 [Dermatophagoides pteronyssinus]